MLNIALPKGRLGEQVYARLADAGCACPGLCGDNRRLIFEDNAAGVRYLLVKPVDVAVYVERGAADIGIAGRDILLEYRPDVYELLDLGLGRCRMCVAAPEGYAEDRESTLRVATKFPNIAKEHYASLGRDIDVIKLNGSIELAPIIGLSDVIVDIVESGMTLQENHLCVLDAFMDISARLISNKSSYKFKNLMISRLLDRLSAPDSQHRDNNEKEKEK